MSAARLVETATAKGCTVATAESCTGGMVAAAITDVAGASAMFDRGFVTYTNAAKVEMLDVREATLADCGAVSEETAGEMVRGALARSGADIAVAITGIAGPGGSDHKPEGRVCFGWGSHRGIAVETIDFGPLGRAEVRRRARDHAIALLQASVEQFAPPDQANGPKTAQ